VEGDWVTPYSGVAECPFDMHSISFRPFPAADIRLILRELFIFITSHSSVSTYTPARGKRAGLMKEGKVSTQNGISGSSCMKDGGVPRP
jgi:hypothetical protein